MRARAHGWAGSGLARSVAASAEAQALVALDLAEDRLGAPGARALAAARLDQLVVLRLAGNQLGDEGARALAAARSLPSLRALDLAGNAIGDDGVCALCASPLASRLAALDLGGNRVGPAGARALARLSSLVALDLGGNPLGDEGARALADGALGVLAQLELRRTQLTGRALWALAGAPALGRLVALGLGRNHIDAGGVRALVRAAAALAALDLYANPLGDDGAAALAAAPLAALERLNLTRAGLGDDGARALARGQLPRLTTLELGNNRIGDEGARALAASPRLPSLARLVLDGNPCDPAVTVVDDRGPAPVRAAG
jgi:Ran GTPase-activating protein (RanGAP) involved in mRNA processing and transport